MAHRMARFWLLPPLAALSVGCTTIRADFNTTDSETSALDFSNGNSYAVPIPMSSPVTDESHYRGQLFRITKDSPLDGTRPVWSLQFPGWNDEHRWDATAIQDAVTHYADPLQRSPNALSGECTRCNVQPARPYWIAACSTGAPQQ